MPRRLTQTKPGTRQAMKNTSYESRVVSWLMQDGWQVFLPVLDHGHQTDILISDGPNYFRVQVKTIGAKGEEHSIRNQWANSNVDCVVFFAYKSVALLFLYFLFSCFNFFNLGFFIRG